MANVAQRFARCGTGPPPCFLWRPLFRHLGNLAWGDRGCRHAETRRYVLKRDCSSKRRGCPPQRRIIIRKTARHWCHCGPAAGAGLRLCHVHRPGHGLLEARLFTKVKTKNMTISKPNWVALAAMAALLLTGLTVQAQDTNTTAAGKQSAGTNQVLEDTNPTTNAPPSESTGVHQDALVRIRKDVELKAGDTADGVVVVFGSAKIHGHAHDVVAVFGNITVDGEVDGDTVAVGGGIKVEPTGVLHHDAVAVGGKVDVDKGGKVEGRIEDID